MSKQGASFDINKMELRNDDGTEYFVLWKVIFNDFAIVALQTKETATSVPMLSNEVDRYFGIVDQTHYRDLMRRWEELKKQKMMEQNFGK